MKLQQLTYQYPQGWSAPLPTDLDSPNTLIFLFGPPAFFEFQRDEITKLEAAFPLANKLGCSTEATVMGDALQKQTILAICQFEKTEVVSVVRTVPSPAESLAVGRQLGEGLKRDGLRLVMVVADDTGVNINELTRGLNETLPPDVLVTGGLAGNPDILGGPRYVWANNQVSGKLAMAIGLSGDELVVSQASQGGWAERSAIHEVTRADGRILYELDGKPAYQVYLKFLGVLASYMTSNVQHVFPVGFYDSPYAHLRVVRSVVGLDPANGSLIFPGEVPDCHYMRFMSGLPMQFIESASFAAEAAVQQHPLEAINPVLSLMVSCVGRYYVMQADAPKEAQAVHAKLPSHAVQIGFYGHGEIAPSGVGGCELHNHTINITLLGEKAAN